MEKLIDKGVALLPYLLLLTVAYTIFIAIRDSPWKTVKQANKTWRQWWKAVLGLTIHWLAVVVAVSSAILSDQATGITERNLRTLESRVRPRSISAEQKTNIVHCLNGKRTKGQVKIFASISDEEAMAYAKDFEDVLGRSGFEVERPSSPHLVYGGFEGKFEVQIHGSPELANRPHFGGTIQHCFAEHGIKLAGKFDASIPSNVVEILIPQKKP